MLVIKQYKKRNVIRDFKTITRDKIEKLVWDPSHVKVESDFVTVNRIGVLVAVASEGVVNIGWSKCRKGDKFNKDFGTLIAVGRAMRANVRFNNVPDSILNDVIDFHGRVCEWAKSHDHIVQDMS